MTDAQTEARAIAERLTRQLTRAEEGAGTMPARQAVKLHPDDWNGLCRLVCEAAAALAAKDAELAVLRAELNDCASEIHELRAQIERAEAQLAEARKALANYDRWLNGRDAYIVQKGLWQNFVASLPGSPTDRRALEGGQEE